ncbi:hypothetical protein EB155_10325 [archaeon]|nr:hypothetical protein [archaeon]
MLHKYTVFELEVNPNYNGFNNIVVGCKIHVNSTHVYNENSINLQTETVDTYRLLEHSFDVNSANTESFINYENLTNDLIVSWIPDTIKQALEQDIENELLEKANVLLNWEENKKIKKELPWNNA